MLIGICHSWSYPATRSWNTIFKDAAGNAKILSREGKRRGSFEQGLKK
jgi:hypothetical protein